MSDLTGKIILFVILIIFINVIMIFRFTVFSGFNRKKLLFSVIALDLIFTIGFVLKLNNVKLSTNTLIVLTFLFIAICFMYFYNVEKKKKDKD
ncbi:MAG: hypothetical protein ACE3L7_17075 [Candidatus Pristimantibacillus sp.]